jgi:hypothetical protein
MFRLNFVVFDVGVIAQLAMQWSGGECRWNYTGYRVRIPATTAQARVRRSANLVTASCFKPSAITNAAGTTSDFKVAGSNPARREAVAQPGRA